MSSSPDIFTTASNVRSAAVSSLTKTGLLAQNRLHTSLSPAEASSKTSEQNIEHQLFDHRLQLKVAVSKLSMHLPGSWRKSIFRQIDSLYSMEDWDEDSTFVRGDAFQTLLRFTIFSTPTKLPGLAIAPNGNPVASWSDGVQRIHIEFQANDTANALLAKTTERGPEAVSWRGPVTNLRSFVEAFGVASSLGW